MERMSFMKSKKITTALLLAFVFISLGYLILQQRKAPSPSSPEVPAKASSGKPYLQAYYFHGNSRCYTCNTIEAYAKETLESEFAEEMTNKRLFFQTVNAEQPENNHFIQDFQLTSPTVILARHEGDEVLEFKNLNQVWKLVKNKEAFQTYIRDETRAMLQEAH
jgi:hypothetical protein